MGGSYAFGTYRLDISAEILFRDAEPLPVGRRAVALLRKLLEQPGAPVSKDALIEAAWPGLAVEESNLTVQIAALRRVLGSTPGGDRWIETMPRRGYRFIGPVGTEAQKSTVEAPPQFDAAPELEPTPHKDTERRQITAVSCELTGNARRADGMDLEDWREAVGAFRRCVSETITRHNGFIASYLGNTVLVLFGYPAAHEHDAERAVRAALELCAAVRTLRPVIDPPMRCRVGVATGMAIVGDMAEGRARDPEIVGDTPDLAVRLQTSAHPGTVAIDRATRQLVGNLFDCRDLDAIETDGSTEPMRRWQVLAERIVESRFEALHGSRLTALVGRDEELELLLRRWSRAKAGEGQVVLLSGEAGIGKSRLTAALLERLAGEPHTRLRYFCSPQHTDSAFYAIIGQMERAAGFRHDDTPQVKCEKLDAILAQTSTSIEDVALLADMLSLSNDGRYSALESTPQDRRARTLEALVAQLVALTRQNPVLMIVEDAHWIDPTSLEAFGRVMDRIVTLPVLLIVTFRPEFDPPWIGQPYVTALTINRLTQGSVGTLINLVVGDKPLPANIQNDIIERADGIPLFVEEMTKAVLEAESEGDAQRTVAAVPSPAMTVPASLHASLMARLDRIGPAKKLAQVGSAIGREFTHVILSAVVRMSEAELLSALDPLVATGLLLRQGVPPHATYLFKHALVQDAAYGTLLRESRRALHARIAEALETQFPEIVESRPELLARHCTEAGLIEKAARLWGKAGQRSLKRSALVEAVAQLSRALDHIATLPGTPALRREQIELQIAFANALKHTQGFAAPETKASFDQARSYFEAAQELGEPPEDPLLLFSILYGSWSANTVALDSSVSCHLAAQFLALAEKQTSIVPLMIGHRLMGDSLKCTGHITQAREHYDQAIALYDPAEHRPLATRFGQDVGVAILCKRSWTMWLLGYPDAARNDIEHVLKDAREIGQAATLMYALFHTSLTHMWRGEYAAANAQADEVVNLADKTGTGYWKAYGTANRGCLFVLTGKASKAIQIISSGVTAWRSMGSTMWIPFYLSYLARAYGELDQYDDSLRCIVDAMKAVETTKETWCEAEVHRIAGEIALIPSRPDAATSEAYFERALAIARAQAAKSWELRAAMSMARLWRDQGKRNEARELLAPVYSWFTEGFDTRDLKEAKTLLDELT
jgi:class 3 adenylate cyclase/predicted ATPase